VENPFFLLKSPAGSILLTPATRLWWCVVGRMGTLIYFWGVKGYILITETSIIDVGGSFYVLVLKPLAEYFKLKPAKCKIEDTGR